MSYILEFLCLVLFLVLVALPSLYGFYMYMLMHLSHRKRPAVRAQQRQQIETYQRTTAECDWPLVTTQLPIYNEVTVARRVIEAAARMDYPAGRHDVQVLDDSTDATRGVVDSTVAALRAEGLLVSVVRRPNRAHYKAGALAHGLKEARGEYVAVFDADFVPDPGFLRRMIPLIANRPEVGFVQARWGHLNEQENWVTQGLALGLDMHFAVEQAARNWNGLLMNFNGTGGIWRKAAISDPNVGGWSGDTITEDLDLSYRAQLAGWGTVYTDQEVCPAEIPANVDALKSQQRRWAVGIMQVARKVLPDVWRSPRLSVSQKVHATIHLTQYMIALPMVLVALVGRILPLMLTGDEWPRWIQWLCTSFLLAATAPCVAYVYARAVLDERLPSVARIIKLIVLGLGMCVNNAFAVLQGLYQNGGEFVRTPKSGSTGRAAASNYAILRSRLWLIELSLGIWCFIQWVAFLPIDGIGGTFLLLYATGLTLIGWASRPAPRGPRGRSIRSSRREPRRESLAPASGTGKLRPALDMEPALAPLQ